MYDIFKRNYENIIIMSAFWQLWITTGVPVKNDMGRPLPVSLAWWISWKYKIIVQKGIRVKDGLLGQA